MGQPYRFDSLQDGQYGRIRPGPVLVNLQHMGIINGKALLKFHRPFFWQPACMALDVCAAK